MINKLNPIILCFIVIRSLEGPRRQARIRITFPIIVRQFILCTSLNKINSSFSNRNHPFSSLRGILVQKTQMLAFSSAQILDRTSVRRREDAVPPTKMRSEIYSWHCLMIFQMLSNGKYHVDRGYSVSISGMFNVYNLHSMQICMGLLLPHQCQPEIALVPGRPPHSFPNGIPLLCYLPPLVQCILHYSNAPVLSVCLSMRIFLRRICKMFHIILGRPRALLALGTRPRC